MRLTRILGTGFYLCVLAAGSLTVGSGCDGGGGGKETLVPAKTDGPSPEEQKERKEAMKKAMETKNKQR